jgi:DHA2 family multidrug resistance protein
MTVADPGTSSAAAQDSFSRHNPWLTAVVATLPTFMEVLNTSIANVTLPHMAGSLGAAVEDSTWVLTSYLVANAIIMPLSGWFASLMGRRNFYVACVIAFTVASVLCGLATSMPMLVFFRLLQGLGGGGLQPITQAILVDTFPVQKRAMGMAVYGMTVVVAPIIGPILGGWIAETYTWRWIFFLNLPIGLISAALAFRLIEDPPYLKRKDLSRLSVDYLSIGLLTVWLGGLQMALDLGERLDWLSSDVIFLLGVASCATGVLFLVRQWHAREPLVNLRLLRERNFALSTIVMALFGFILYSTTALLPLFMQTVLGYTSTTSGAALAPGGVAVMLLMPIVGMLGPRVDVRWVIAVGYLVIAWSLWLMAEFNLEVDFGTIITARSIQGVGLAFTFVPINALAYAYVAKEARNEASSILSLARNIGASIGIALATVLVTRSGEAHRTYLVSHLTPFDPAYRQALDGSIARGLSASGDPVMSSLAAQTGLSQLAGLQAHGLAYLDAFAVLSLGVLLMVPLVLLMRRPAQPAAMR